MLGHQHLPCLPFQDKKCFEYNREDFVFICTSWVEGFVLSPGNVRNSVLPCKVMLHLTISAEIDGQDEPLYLECAYVALTTKLRWTGPSGK